MKPALLTLLLASPPALAADNGRLTLDEYLDQVSGNSPSVAAAKLLTDSGLRQAEADSVLTFPYLHGSLSSFDDRAETAFPAFQGSGTDGNAYSLGIGWSSPVGVNGKYSWNSTFYNTKNMPAASQGPFTSYNKLDLTVNLLRNGLGSETRARKEVIRAGHTAQSIAGRYQHVARLAEAEAAYWRLAFARQAVLVRKEVLARAEKLLQWAKRRVGLQLGDRSDLLQAQASHDLQVLELNATLEEERASRRAFNVLRNRDDETVPEAVALPSIEETLKIPTPERAGERLDVQAAMERTKVTQANAQLSKEALKPNVDLVASYSWNGREQKRPDAISEALGSRHPTQSIALTFTVPLNAPTMLRALHGADQEIEAAELDLDQTRLGEAKEWNDLSSKLLDARNRLRLASTVESIQKEKHEHERQRLLRGRTTTFQALNFEQDYANAQLLRLRTQSEVLQLLAQLNSFRGNP